MFAMLNDRAQRTMEFLRGISGKVRVANEALATASKSWRDDGLTKREQEYDDRHRALVALEADVAARRRELARRERGLRWQKLGWLLSLALVGAMAFIAGFALSSGSQTQKDTRQGVVSGGLSSAAAAPTQGPKVAEVSSSEPEPTPATASEDADARANSGRYGTGGKFDVGRYCLDKEKEGGVTFEQCLGTAALALRR